MKTLHVYKKEKAIKYDDRVKLYTIKSLHLRLEFI